MSEAKGRTWLCTVVFLDIARYTANPLTQQVRMKSDLDSLILAAVEGVEEKDRIIVDTGDGAALCFLTDPEEALFAALNLRDAYRAESHGSAAPLQVRIGVNLGPVRMVTAATGQPSPVGDGINTAQRVMSFADPNQILISRSFHDVISCLSQEYAALFHYVGKRVDKHGRKHVLYEVVVPGEAGSSGTTLLVKETYGNTRSRPEVQAQWDPALLDSLEQLLAGQLGPLAGPLLRKATQRTPGREELGRCLAESLPAVQDHGRFLQQLAELLGLSMKPVATTPRADTGPPSVPGESVRFQPELLDHVRNCLAEQLGPLAGILLKKAARECSTAQELVDRLAQELETEQQRAAFRVAVSRSPGH